MTAAEAAAKAAEFTAKARKAEQDPAVKYGHLAHQYRMIAQQWSTRATQLRLAER